MSTNTNAPEQNYKLLIFESNSNYIITTNLVAVVTNYNFSREIALFSNTATAQFQQHTLTSKITGGIGLR